MIILHSHYSDCEDIANEIRRELESEPERFEVGPFDPKVFCYNIAPQTEGYEVGGEEVLQHVVLLVNHGGHISEEARRKEYSLDRIGGFYFCAS